MSSNISYVQEPYTRTGKLYYTLPGIYNKILEGLVRSTFLWDYIFKLNVDYVLKMWKVQKIVKKVQKKNADVPTFSC